MAMHYVFLEFVFVTCVLLNMKGVSTSLQRENMDCGLCRCWKDYSIRQNTRYGSDDDGRSYRGFVVNCKSLDFDKIPTTIESDATSIYLSHNRISHVTKKSLEHYSLTENLDLSYNAISLVERDAFSNMDHLRILSLTHNELTWLYEQTFQTWIIRVDLSYNKLKRVPDINSDSNIHMMRIAYNELEELSVSDLKGLTSETRQYNILDVSFNELRTFSVDLAQRLEGVLADDGEGYIILDGNPWVCDCHMKQLKSIWPHHPLCLIDSIYCDTPANLKGRNIWSIADSELVCEQVMYTEASLVGIAIGCFILGSVLSLAMVFIVSTVRRKLKDKHDSDTFPPTHCHGSHQDT